jgi:hypothetical protein
VSCEVHTTLSGVAFTHARFGARRCAATAGYEAEVVRDSQRIQLALCEEHAADARWPADAAPQGAEPSPLLRLRRLPPRSGPLAVFAALGQ